MNTLNMFLLQAQGQPGSSWSGLLLIVVIFVIFWLFIIRPQNKKQWQLHNRHRNAREYAADKAGI